MQALKLLMDAEPKYRSGDGRIRLILAGSVRNEGDEGRVVKLRKLAKELNIEASSLFGPSRSLLIALCRQDNVEFAINVPYPELISLFGKASIGMHTMIDEHFGITVVEFMVSQSCLVSARVNLQ